jgi:branched-chain amino acid transport system ATP-binding protein
MLLRGQDLTVHYGKAMALDSVSIEIEQGVAFAVLGANGAGKTTLLRAISGLTPLTSGEIWFMNNRIDGMSAPDIVRLGIIHIPEGRRLFPDLTVLNNLKLGASLRNDKDQIKKDFDKVFEYFPILHERNNQKARTLSGGEQQMLAIARGLMAKPKFLLMDEPSLGLAPKLVEELGSIIENISRKEGVSILLVEQNIGLACQVAIRGFVLQVGRIVFKGSVRELENSDMVKQAYLGGIRRRSRSHN